MYVSKSQLYGDDPNDLDSLPNGSTIQTLPVCFMCGEGSCFYSSGLSVGSGSERQNVFICLDCHDLVWSQIETDRKES